MAAKELKSKKLILVEGDHEVRFIRVLLEKYGCKQDIEIEFVQGKDNFSKVIPSLELRTGFDNVELLAIVRDADDNPAAAFQSVRDVLLTNNYASPSRPGEVVEGKPRTGIFILPENDKPGMLEDLCLATKFDHPVMECVEAFFQCVATKDVEQPVNISKAKAQAFLSAMPKTLYNIGIAAEKGYWDLEKDCLKDLVNFLKQIIET